MKGEMGRMWESSKPTHSELGAQGSKTIKGRLKVQAYVTTGEGCIKRELWRNKACSPSPIQMNQRWVEMAGFNQFTHFFPTFKLQNPDKDE